MFQNKKNIDKQAKVCGETEMKHSILIFEFRKAC